MTDRQGIEIIFKEKKKEKEIEIRVYNQHLPVFYFFPKTFCILHACKEAIDFSNILSWEFVRVIATVVQIPSALTRFLSL